MAGDVFEGRTLDAAVNKGLEALGLSRAEVMITILEEGSGGFLGFGSRPYRVRVMRRPGGPPHLDADEERRRRSGRERRDRGGRERGREGGRERGGRERGREGGRERGGAPVAAQGGPQGRREGRGAERREERRPDERRERRPERREQPAGERREQPPVERREQAAGEQRRDDRRERREHDERRPAAEAREGRGERRGEERREERRFDERREERREERRGERPAERPPMPAEGEPMMERPQDLPREDHLLEGAPGLAGEPRRRRRRGRRGGRRRHGGEVVAPMVIEAEEGALLPSHMVEHPDESEPIADEQNEREELVLEGASASNMPEARDEERPRIEETVDAPAGLEEPAGTAREERREERRDDRLARNERSREEHTREERSREEHSREEHSREEHRRDETPALSAEELAAQSRRITEDMLKAMGFEARVTATVDGSHVDVTAEVERDEDLLTGRKGEVRQALQHLLNRVLNRGESSRYHLQLEINDFWKRREEELRELARGLADEAIESDAEVVTEYLNAQERRIVHVTLRDDTRVKTYALGTGMIKRVAIAPADAESGPRPEGE